jgi:hypothetical protein
MPEKQKVYCGMKQDLPEGYARFANRFQCLKKGYGACLYAGRRGRGVPGRREQQQNRLLQQITYRMILMGVFFVVVLVVVFLALNRRRRATTTTTPPS